MKTAFAGGPHERVLEISQLSWTTLKTNDPKILFKFCQLRKAALEEKFTSEKENLTQQQNQ